MTENNPRGVDGLALTGGLVAIAVSVYILAGGFPGIRVDWIVASVIVGVGITLLIASVRTRRER